MNFIITREFEAESTVKLEDELTENSVNSLHSVMREQIVTLC